MAVSPERAPESDMILLGIDVGGSSIKAGLVDVTRGELTTELISLPTPQPSKPDAVMLTIAELSRRLPTGGPAGFAFPSVVTHGKARTAANVDEGWIGADGVKLGSDAIGRPVVFLNDADAAGIAEMKWGAGRDTCGTAIMLTFGTGIGSAIFTEGRLVPNTEFGHLLMPSGEAEHYASARIKTELSLDWPTWIARVNEYLHYMQGLFWPDVFILGGAISENFDEFAPLLRSSAEIRPARFTAQAGVIGAALAAAESLDKP
jgi:polyphosphate glucokinase